MNETDCSRIRLALTLLVLLTVHMPAAAHAGEKRMSQLRRESEELTQSLTKDISLNMANMLGRDLAEAKEAVDYFAGFRMMRPLALALRHDLDEIQGHAAKRLGEMDDQRALPMLLDALKANNTAVVGGTEGVHRRRDLLRNIMTAIGQLIGRDFSQLDPKDDRQLLLAQTLGEYVVKNPGKLKPHESDKVHAGQ